MFPNFVENKDTLNRDIETNPKVLIDITRNSERNWYEKSHKSIF